MLDALVAKIIGAVLLAVLAFGGGAYVGYRFESGKVEAVQAKFSAYQASVASAEAQTRLNDLNAQTAAEKAAQTAVAAANDRARSLEVARVEASQELHDTIAKESKTNAPLAKCLAAKLPSSVLRGLAR